MRRVRISSKQIWLDRLDQLSVSHAGPPLLLLLSKHEPPPQMDVEAGATTVARAVKAVRLLLRRCAFMTVSRYFFTDASPPTHNLIDPSLTVSQVTVSQAATDASISILTAARDAAMQELDELVGIEPVKKQVLTLCNEAIADQRRSLLGISPVPKTRHMLFLGNAGTGKTTVAKIIAGLLHRLGVVPTNKFKVYDSARSALVAGVVGETPKQTRKVLTAAEGGVLFLDEVSESLHSRVYHKVTCIVDTRALVFRRTRSSRWAAELTTPRKRSANCSPSPKRRGTHWS